MTPSFTLTAEQRAQIDAVRSDDAKTMLLQVFHQVHAFAHRDRSLFGMVADPAVFSRVWLASEYENMAEAWAVYRAMPSAPAFVLRTEPFGLRPVGLQSLSQRKVA